VTIELETYDGRLSRPNIEALRHGQYAPRCVYRGGRAFDLGPVIACGRHLWGGDRAATRQ
jgi:hypothetical protein